MWKMGPLSVMVLAIAVSFVAPLWRVWPVVAHAFFHVASITTETKRCPCPASARAADTNHSRHAIVMLVQDQDVGVLQASLESLDTYFNSCFRKDVYVFHTGGIPARAQDAFTKLFPQVRVHRLRNGSDHWHMGPVNRATKDALGIVKWYAAGRWHAIGVYDFLHERGYEWLMRVEPGIRILSCVRPDPFQLVESRGLSHGYRLGRLIHGKTTPGVPEVLRSYATKEGHPLPQRLLGHFEDGALRTAGWDRWTFDASMMVTKIAFWRSKKVRVWHEWAQSTAVLPAPATHTLALLAFLKEEDVYRFTEWSFVYDGALAIAVRNLLPSVLSGLIPERYEWTSNINDLRADPRYKQEANWMYRNIMTPVNRKEYWVFRFLKYLT